jgi:hypothetical protein
VCGATVPILQLHRRIQRWLGACRESTWEGGGDGGCVITAAAGHPPDPGVAAAAQGAQVERACVSRCCSTGTLHAAVLVLHHPGSRGVGGGTALLRTADGKVARGHNAPCGGGKRATRSCTSTRGSAEGRQTDRQAGFSPQPCCPHPVQIPLTQPGKAGSARLRQVRQAGRAEQPAPERRHKTWQQGGGCCCDFLLAAGSSGSRQRPRQRRRAPPRQRARAA